MKDKNRNKIEEDKQLNNLLMSEEDTITIKEAIDHARKRWQEQKL